MMSRIVPLIAIAALVLAGCNGKASAPLGAETSRDASAFIDRYFDAYFTFSPSDATSAGFHNHDDELENRSSARIQSRIAELQRMAGEVAALRRTKLSGDDVIDTGLIENRIQSELLDLQTLGTWHSPLYYAGIPGNAVDLLMKRNFAAPAARLRSLTRRIGRIPALMDAMRENTQNPPKEFTDLAIRIVRGSVPFFRDSVSEWARTAAGSDTALLDEFTTANKTAVASLAATVKHLETRVLPASTGSYAIGAESFARKLRYDEMVDMPLDKLLAIGEARLAEDHKAFIEVAAQIAPGKEPADAVGVLEKEHPDEAGLIGFARSTLDSAREFVRKRNIIPIPSDELPRLEPTPPYARSGAFASMDTPGPYETSAREAFYYVTPAEKDWSASHKEEHLRLFNRPVMDLITIHEAFPGHYVQFLYVKQFPTKTRKLIFCGTNVEGWAHYSEQMMLEEGFGNGDPSTRLAQLSEALVRDARYVAGIRLHTSGWSVDQATRIFEEQAFMQHANAFEEARRGAYNPTYLYYTLGKMQIYKLRADYKQAKGSAYSLAGFHEAFVRQGGIPVQIIRRILLPGDTGSDL